MKNLSYITALSIAGSDSSGGAGVQADLKTFSALGCYGMTAITAITAQNTLGVQGVYAVDPKAIQQQLNSIKSNIKINVIKIGMLHSVEVINVVSDFIEPLYTQIPVVLDPVMIAKGGDRLLLESAVDALREKLFPMATVVTPNLPEASIFIGRDIYTKDEMAMAARHIGKMGPQAVIIKGGHLEEELDTSEDCLWEKEKGKLSWVSSPRITTSNTHGTGCTFASAVASYLAHGKSLKDAMSLSKDYVYNALISGAHYKIGGGHGPLNHFWKVWVHA